MAKKQKAESRKQKGAASGPPRTAGEVRLSEHPRAKQQIRLAKSWAGLGGFALAGYAGWKAGLPFFDATLRALFWGVVAYVVVWACAVQVWRHLAIAEVRAVERRWREQRDEQVRLTRERIEAEAAQKAAAAAER